MPVIKIVNPPGSGPIWRHDLGAGAGASRDFMNFQKDGIEVFSVDSNGLPDPGGGDAKRAVTCLYGDVAADSDALEAFIWRAEKGVTITGVRLCVDADTADGSVNGQTLTLKRSSDNGQVVQYTTPANNPALSQATWYDMGSVTNASLSADEYLYLTFTKVNSGLALSGLCLLIEYTLAE